MKDDIIIGKRTPKGISLNRPISKDIIINQQAGGGSNGVTFSVEDGHILVIKGKVSVENNDTIVL